MNKQGPAKPVERLFPFVLRSRNLMVGRETLGRNKSRLHFVLITLDISEQSRAEVLSEFAHYPVVQLYTSAELEQFFGVKGTKVIGFQKSGLAQSIYAELKQHRLNKPGGRGIVPSADSAETRRPGESPPDAPPQKSSPIS
jgi:hypothetical protein